MSTRQRKSRPMQPALDTSAHDAEDLPSGRPRKNITKRVKPPGSNVDLNTFILPPRAKSADTKLAEEIGDRLALLLAAKARFSKN